MTKAYSRKKLGLTSSHRKLLLRNLAQSLFVSEKLILPFKRAKELQRFSEKIISIAKQPQIISYRKVARDIKDRSVIKKIFDIIVPRFAERKSGHIQVFKLPHRRRGDGVELSVIRLVQ